MLILLLLKMFSFPEHVDLITSEDVQLTEICKGNKYLQIELHWTVLIIIFL
jgi:hypothetical protein